MLRSMLQGIIDTNVLVRAFLKTDGSDGKIFEAFKRGDFELLYSDITINELIRVLGYKRIFNRYGYFKWEVDLFVKTIIAFGSFVYAPKKVKLCRDPDDDEILSIALAIYTKKPIYVVSSDEDLLALKGKIEGVKIVVASEFLKILK